MLPEQGTRLAAPLHYGALGISLGAAPMSIKPWQRAGGLQNTYVHADRHWLLVAVALLSGKGQRKGAWLAGGGRDRACDHCRSSRVDVTDTLTASRRYGLHGDAVAPGAGAQPGHGRLPLYRKLKDIADLALEGGANPLLQCGGECLAMLREDADLVLAQNLRGKTGEGFAPTSSVASTGWPSGGLTLKSFSITVRPLRGSPSGRCRAGVSRAPIPSHSDGELTDDDVAVIVAKLGSIPALDVLLVRHAGWSRRRRRHERGPRRARQRRREVRRVRVGRLVDRNIESLAALLEPVQRFRRQVDRNRAGIDAGAVRTQPDTGRLADAASAAAASPG